MKTIISVKNLSVAYDKTPVIEDVFLDIPRGSLLAIVGPNGAGKSTLLKAILGIVSPLQGEIDFSIDGVKTKNEALKQIAYVPQNGSVNWDFPATVLDIVLMGRYGKLGWFKRPGQADKDLARQILKRVGMSEYENRQISELSGGQQQRVFLARAILQDAQVYFLDEPFKGIDVQTESIIVSILKEMQEEGKTMTVVHHALHTVPEYFDHVVFINHRIVASGTVEETFTDDRIKHTFLPLGVS